MVVIAMMAVLTAGAIPSFSEFGRSQSLYQAFKTLKSNLRVAQSKSLAGSENKAWGVHFPLVPGSSYTIFRCTPVASLSQYSEYVFANARCGSGSSFKTFDLGTTVRITILNPSNASGLDVVFDAQNGSTVANGVQPNADVTLTLNSVSGTSNPQTLKITQGGGIID